MLETTERNKTKLSSICYMFNMFPLLDQLYARQVLERLANLEFLHTLHPSM